MTRRLSEEDKGRAVALYLEHPEITAAAICAQFGISHNALSNWVKARGHAMARKGGRRYAPDFEESVVQFYLENPKATTAEICQRFGIVWETLQKWLVARGIEHRRRYGRHYLQEDIDLAVEMYVAGKRLDEIEAAIGCSRSTIASWLKAAEVVRDRHRHRKGRPLLGNSKFTSEQVRLALDLYLADVPVRVIVERTGASKDTIYDWLGRWDIKRNRTKRGVTHLNRYGAKGP